MFVLYNFFLPFVLTTVRFSVTADGYDTKIGTETRLTLK